MTEVREITVPPGAAGAFELIKAGEAVESIRVEVGPHGLRIVVRVPVEMQDLPKMQAG